jgi:virginiamycin A acetyltransferase
VPPYTVVAGVPAKEVRKRFDEETIAKLLEVKWWDLPDEEVEKLLPDLVAGNVDSFAEKAGAAWKK